MNKPDRPDLTAAFQLPIFAPAVPRDRRQNPDRREGPVRIGGRRASDLQFEDLISRLQALGMSATLSTPFQSAGSIPAAAPEVHAARIAVPVPPATPAADTRAASPAPVAELHPTPPRTASGRKSIAADMSHSTRASMSIPLPPAPPPAELVRSTLAALQASEDDGELDLHVEGGESYRNPAPSPTRAISIAASWEDPEIAEKRSRRYQVRVGRTTYRSVSAAFKALGLPSSKVLRFRSRLVREGSARINGHRFTVVGHRKDDGQA